MNGCGKSRLHRDLFFVFSCTLFVLHPYLFRCLDCPAFCLFVLQHTNINAAGRIRTCNPSKRSAAYPRLRPLGHWNRQDSNPGSYKLQRVAIPTELSRPDIHVQFFMAYSWQSSHTRKAVFIFNHCTIKWRWRPRHSTEVRGQTRAF